MYLQEDQQRDAVLKSPTPAQPAAGGFQSRASRAAAPSPYTPSTTNGPTATSSGDARRLTGDFDATPVSRPAAATTPPNAVAVTRQPNGTTSFSGMRVDAGPVQYEGSAKGFKPGGTVNTMSAANFMQANPSTAGTLGDARRTAMQTGNLDAVAASFGMDGGRQGGVNLTPQRDAEGRLGFNQDEARTLLRDAMTKRPGESRADFATRSGAAQRALGLEVDERGNIRGNQTQQRGQNLGFATSEAERQSRELLEARRQKLDGQRLGLDAGRLQLDAFKATQPEAQNAPAGYRWSAQGNLQAIPGGPGDKSQALRPMPSSAAGGLLENRRNARRAVDALALLNGETLPGGTQGDPNATGLKGYLPNQILNRLDPAGVDTRAAIADLGSMVINDRSGAAVTAAEFPRLAPFIPSEKDDPETARKKLQNFARNYGAIVNDTEEFYRASGYNVPDAETTQQPAPAPARQSGPAAVPQAGQVVRGYRFLGGDPSDRNNWEAGQ